MTKFGARSLVEQSYQAVDRHLAYWSTLGTPNHLEDMTDFMQLYGDGRNNSRSYTPQQQIDRAEGFANMEQAIWANAPTTVLDPEVRDLIIEASGVMPPAPLRLAETGVPAFGVIMMPNEEMMFDYLNETDTNEDPTLTALPVTAVGWIRVAKGVGVVDPATKETVNEDGVILYLYASPRAVVAKSHDFVLGRRAATKPLIWLDFLPWAENASWVIADKTILTNDPKISEDGHVITDPHVARARKFMMALWAFMADEIVRSPQQYLPRPLQRRVKRLAPLHGGLRITQIRKVRYVGREEGEGEGEGSREYSHRWLVKGHWRHLPSGRLTYVRSHIKGPPSKPIIVKNDVYAVRR
jgi:hypothetical protein